MNHPSTSETMGIGHDVTILEKKITALSDALAHLSSDKDVRELLKIIKKPGWTTPAEFRFSESILDSLTAQVQSVADLKQQFVAGARLVGQ